MAHQVEFPRRRRSWLLRGLLVSCAILLADSVASEGSPWVGSKGVSRTVAELMAQPSGTRAQKRLPAETERKKVRPRREGLPQNPLSPDTPYWPPRLARFSAEAVASPQTPGVSFTGATLADTLSFPPDSMGAAGPTQYLVGVNGRIRVHDKTTGAVGALDLDMDVFFASVRNGSITTDPRVRYDRTAGRWFVLIINVETPNRVLLAVTNGPTINPATVWTFFFFRQDQVSPAGDATCSSDYPSLGLDANALYIGVNQFCPTSYAGTAAFVVRKSSVLGAGPIVVSAFRNLTGTPFGAGPYSPQGVDNYDAVPAEGYIIGVDNATFGTLMLRRVTDPGGTPSISANILISVAATFFPYAVRHLGNNNDPNGRLDAIDDRLFDAVVRNGRLWTAHNIGVNNTGMSTSQTRTGVRWYEIGGLATATPSPIQSGTLFTASPVNDLVQRNYFIPSVMVSGQGHVAMGMSTAGSNEYANAATVGRLAGDVPGTLGAPLLYTASAFAYNPPGDTGNMRGSRRWGDYSSTSLDPCDDMTMWTIQQFTDATDSYGVRVVKLFAPPPATPASAVPAVVPAGQASINVVVTGASASGSGFYDPGPGFACRLGAAFSGGVAVNSVTYTSPTSVTLNVSTISSLPGPKTLTMTNPDSQAAASLSGLLTVSAPIPFFTATPCRVLDTRDPAGPWGGPALAANTDRTFTVIGRCGVPTTASAVSVNLTVTQPSAQGNLRLRPGGTALPLVSSINYSPGQTRANNAIVPLGEAGDIAVRCTQASGTVHFILDVNGYFE